MPAPFRPVLSAPNFYHSIDPAASKSEPLEVGIVDGALVRRQCCDVTRVHVDQNCGLDRNPDTCSDLVMVTLKAFVTIIRKT